jgi:hypothetical protein
MKISGIIYYICLFGSALILALCFLLDRSYFWIPVIFIISALWWIAGRKELNKLSSICFIIYIFFSIKCILISDNFILPVTGLLFSIFCWDAEYFNRRLNMASQVVNRKRIEKYYIFRVTIICILSLIICFFTAGITIHFSFFWILVLSSLAILVLGKINRMSDRDI